MLNLVKNLFYSLLLLCEPRYLLVYKNAKGHVKRFRIARPRRENEFGNKVEGLKRVGFKTTCFRAGKPNKVRSFRYDRVVSLTRV